jgi:Amt family ammonium transporter
MVRQKNALGTLMHSFIAALTVQWVLGPVSFGPDKGGIIGGLMIGLRAGLSPSTYSKTIPHQAFMLFQMMFAIITPALITARSPSARSSRRSCLHLALGDGRLRPLAHWVG